jgi:hypothetical protein
LPLVVLETVGWVVVILRAFREKFCWEMARVVRLSASLRWHDPDQVRRSKLGEASSQPGIPDSRVRCQSSAATTPLRPAPLRPGNAMQHHKPSRQMPLPPLSRVTWWATSVETPPTDPTRCGISSIQRADGSESVLTQPGQGIDRVRAVVENAEVQVRTGALPSAADEAELFTRRNVVADLHCQ